MDRDRRAAGNGPVAPGGRGADRPALVRCLLRSARAVLLHGLRAADARSAAPPSAYRSRQPAPGHRPAGGRCPHRVRARSLAALAHLPRARRLRTPGAHAERRLRRVRATAARGRARAPRTRRKDAGAGHAPRAESAPSRTPEPGTRVPHPHGGRRRGAALERARTPGGPPPARRRPAAGAREPAPPDAPLGDGARAGGGPRRGRARRTGAGDTGREADARPSSRVPGAPRARLARALPGPLRRDRVRRVHRHLSGRDLQRVHRLERQAHPLLPHARTPHAHDPPAVAHRRSHSDRRVIQLLAVAAVHARRHQHA